MSKERRGAPAEHDGARQHAPGASRAAGVEPVAEQERGNQAAQASLGASVDRETAVTQAAEVLAEHVSLALSVDPMDRGRTEELLEHVARSALPEERRAAIYDHLHTSQEAADGVAAAMARWCGGDDLEQRSAMVAALGRVAQAPIPGAGTVAEAAEITVASLLQQAVPQLDPTAARGLCSQLVLMVELVWDEEEDEGPPPDPLEHAAETVG